MDRQERVTIVSDSFGGDKKFLRLSATFVFINKGQIGYDEVIKRVAIDIEFPDGSKYEQECQDFVTFTHKDGELMARAGALPAIPLQIKAKSALSRDIYFAPFEKRSPPAQKGHERENFLEWNEFMEKLNDGKGKHIKLTFTATEALKNEPIPPSPPCKIEINQDFINTLDYYGWTSSPCWPSKE